MELLTQRMRRTGGKIDTLLDLAAEIHERGHVDYERWPREILQASKQRALDKDTVVGALDGSRVGFLSVPMEVMLRDLNVGSATAGGNLVGSPRKLLEGSLRGFSVMADAGATVLNFEAGTNTPAFPTVTTPPVAGWAADEFSAVPESNTAFGLKTVATKTCGFWFTASRKVLLMGGELADVLLRTEIMSGIGRAIDKAALQGAGSGGEPLGLNGISGVHAQSGTSLAWSGIQNMLQNIGDGGARDANVSFIGTPAVRELLAQREKASGSGVIWDGPAVAGLPAAVSMECPSGTLFAGDFSKLVISIHGGIDIRIDRNRVTDGSAKFVVLADVDIAVTYPAVFSRATGIT